MLEFNLEHKSIESGRGLKNNTNKLGIRNIAIGGILITSIFLFSGCVKDIDCNITDLHAHNYINEQSFDKYMISEKEHNGMWIRTDDYIITNKVTKELIEFENKKGLFRISNNRDKIKKVTALQNDYMEYRFKYTWLQPIQHIIRNGKNTTTYYTYVPRTGYSWTTNPEHSRLTGEQRIVHYMYYGYKVVRNEKDKLEIVQSEMVDNLDELSADFIYIKPTFYKKVNSNDKNVEIDYEDGAEEDKSQQEDYEQQSENEIENPNSKGR